MDFVDFMVFEAPTKIYLQIFNLLTYITCLYDGTRAMFVGILIYFTLQRT